MSPVPKLEIEEANTTGWKNLVSTDGPGILKGVGVVHAYAEMPHVRIQIDDTVNIEEKVGSAWTQDCGNGGLNLDLPFNDSLQVDIRDYKYPRPQTKFWVSVILGPVPGMTKNNDE